MRLKICGLTDLSQAKAIATLGATDLGFICVPSSPRYIKAGEIGNIVENLPKQLKKIGVFANAEVGEIAGVMATTHLTGMQLHGDESPEFCQHLKTLLPDVELIKALRIRDPETLAQAKLYQDHVDILLLDAYHPQMLGGTGVTINWQLLAEFQPSVPWFLAGGLTPDNVVQAVESLKPAGIDVSSGVERSPGDKDLDKVKLLFTNLKNARR